jgi:ferredoxin
LTASATKPVAWEEIVRRIVIDTEKCAGNGMCFQIAPDLFGEDDRAYGVVTGDGTFSDDLRGDADNAVMACPEGAIAIVDD